jgi:hypothetical protein
MLFRRINRSEFESMAWTNQEKNQKAPQIVLVATTFNKVAQVNFRLHYGHLPKFWMLVTRKIGSSYYVFS